MATGTISLPIPGGYPPDGTGTINNPAIPGVTVSSAAQTANAPKITHHYLKFPKAADAHWFWDVILPGNYASGGTLRCKLATNSTSTNGVVMKAGTAIAIDSNTDLDQAVSDTVVTATVTPANVTEKIVEFTIALTMTNAAANRKITVWIGRDVDAGGDTNVNEAWLTNAELEYTMA